MAMPERPVADYAIRASVIFSKFAARFTDSPGDWTQSNVVKRRHEEKGGCGADYRQDVR
jgi:hypothetical protein